MIEVHKFQLENGKFILHTNDGRKYNLIGDYKLEDIDTGKTQTVGKHTETNDTWEIQGNLFTVVKFNRGAKITEILSQSFEAQKIEDLTAEPDFRDMVYYMNMSKGNKYKSYEDYLSATLETDNGVLTVGNKNKRDEDIFYFMRQNSGTDPMESANHLIKLVIEELLNESTKTTQKRK